MVMTPPKQTQEPGPWDQMPEPGEQQVQPVEQQQPWQQLPDFNAPAPAKFDLSATIAMEKEDPDRSTRILKAADESRLPIDFVERNLDQLERDIAKKGFDPKKYREQNPIVSEWLSQNPHYFSAARNDLGFFARLEKDVAAAGDRAQQLIGGQMRTAYLMAPQLKNLIPAGLRLPLEEAINQSDITDELEMLADSYRSVMGEKQGRELEPGTSWEDVKRAPLQNIVPYIISTGIVSAPDMAAALINLPAYISARTGELGQERAENLGQQDATLGDLATVMPTVVVMSMLERMGAQGIIGIDDAIRVYGDVPKAIGVAALREGSTEFVQEQMEYGVTTLSTNVDFDIGQSFERGVAGAVGGAGYGATTRSVTAPAQVFMHQRKAEQRQRFFEALGGNSEMREKLPTKMQEAVDKLTRNGPLETMYVPVDAHNEYWQSQNVDPREAAEQIFGSSKYYDDGVASGVMEVPTAAYAAFGAGTEANDFYSRNTTFDPSEMTDSEFEQVMRRMQDKEADSLESSALIGGANPSGGQYSAIIEDGDDGLTIKYESTRGDGRKASVGGRVLSTQEFINEFSITDEDTLDVLSDTESVKVRKIRTNRDGSKADVDIIADGIVEFSFKLDQTIAQRIRSEALSTQDVDAIDPIADVFNSVYGQLQPIYPADVAEKYARYMSIVFDTMAQRTGTTASELYGRYNVNIERRIPEALRNFGGEAEVRNVLQMIREERLPTEDEIYGGSLVSKLREKGIYEDGGEIANRDLDVGQVGRNKINRATAEWTLDDAAEWAYEQGLIPENDQTAFLELLDAELEGQRIQTPQYNERLASVREFADQLQEQFDLMGIDMGQLSDDQILDALFRGVEPKVGGSVLEQAQALGYQGASEVEARGWIAATNAGLDMSEEARMQRAQEMGFDTDTRFFHGTSDDIRAFSLDMTQSRDHGFIGKGVYVTQSPAVADFYANTATPRQRNEQGDFSEPNVMQLFVKDGNYKRYSVADRLDLQLKLARNFSFAEELTAQLQEEGYDGAEVVDASGAIVERVVFDPANIRSVNAAFDPNMADSSTLLAQSEVDDDGYDIDEDEVTPDEYPYIAETSLLIQQKPIEEMSLADLARLNEMDVRLRWLEDNDPEFNPTEFNEYVEPGAQLKIKSGGVKARKVLGIKSDMGLSVAEDFVKEMRRAQEQEVSDQQIPADVRAQVLSNFSNIKAIEVAMSIAETSSADELSLRRMQEIADEQLAFYEQYNELLSQTANAEEATRLVIQQNQSGYNSLMKYNLSNPSEVLRILRVDQTQELQQSQQQTQTPEFQAWFGDSKVSFRGQPTIVYRGRASDSDTMQSSVSYFATDRKVAEDYNWWQEDLGMEPAGVLEAYLSIQNPATADDIERIAQERDIELTNEDYPAAYLEKNPDLVQALKDEGFDGAEGWDTNPATGREVWVYAAFDSTQVKAVDNRGTFDPNDPVIYNQSPTYRSEHLAPSPEFGAPAHDVTMDGMYPNDVYGPNGLRFYGTGSESNKESYRIMQSLRGKPDAEVTIYRAVPKGVGDDINPGDWVSLSKKYAEQHGESVLNGDYKIISKKVAAKEVYTNADSLDEWGYWPDGSYELTLEQFAGRKASGANLTNLATAGQMRADGVSDEVIRRKTGWFLGVDGQWRYEISDDGAYINDGALDVAVDDSTRTYSDEEKRAYEMMIEAHRDLTFQEDASLTREWVQSNLEDIREYLSGLITDADDVTSIIAGFDVDNMNEVEVFNEFSVKRLGQVVAHEKLFDAYPQLRGYPVMVVESEEYGGSFNERTKEITLNVRDTPNRETEALSVLMHEVQHAIQQIEDFARGGAPEQNFIKAVKDVIEQASANENLGVDWWKSRNKEIIEDAELNASIARDALKWESVLRLMDYASRDKPSGVFRLIKNESQWLYAPELQRTDETREIERLFYGIPKRGPKRNQVIREIAERAAQHIRSTIPAHRIQMFKEDNRQLKSMVKALEREASRSRGKLDELRLIEKRAKAADYLYEKTKFKSPYEVYYALAGEIEARTTQARIDLSDEQRQNRSPRMDESVPREEAIVIVGGQEFRIPFVAKSMRQGGEQQPRGTIRFDPQGGFGRDFTITIGENADLSTFLHETGHLFLEIMMDLAEQPGAPQQIVDDVQTLFSQMGIENRSQVQREQHEMFAEWVEKYLAEGKAPTSELRRLFVTFWSWLKRIYRNLDVIGVTKSQLSDDVRRVLDRMVATDEAIAADGDTEQLYKSFDESGMTADEWSEYLRSIEEVRYEAQEQVAAEIMDEYEKTQKKWWRARRKEIKNEIEKQVSQELIYRTLDVLQKGLAPDGGARPEGVKAIKLNKQSIVDLMGEQFLKRLPRPYVYTRDGGMSAQSFANIMGYKDATQMLSEMATAQKKSERINQLVDAELQQRYGDPNFDATIPAMAVGAIHNDRMADVLEIELKSLGRKAAKRVTPRKLVREQAERIIDGKPSRMVKPGVYRRAEQKAANAAFEAAMRGDNVEALRQKQMQMLNFELFRAAQRAQELESKLLDKARSLNKTSAQERIGKAGGDYLEQINGILEQYEFRRTTDKELARRESLRAWIAEKEREGEFLGEEIDIPAEVLDRANRVNYRELPVAELRGVYDLLRQIEHFARMKNRLLAQKKKRDREQAESELIDAVQASMKAKRKMPLSTTEMNTRERMTSKARELDASLLKMEQVLDWLDDGDVQGPWHEILWQPVVEAQAKEQEYTELVTRKVAEALDDVPKETRKKMLDRIGTLNDGTPLTRRSVLGMALNTGNESNMTKLMKGYGLTEAQLQTWLDILTKEEWDFVQRVWDTLEEIYPDIAALEKELRGIEPEKVEAREVRTKYGNYRGGYYPVMYDFQRTEQGEKQLASNIGGLMDTSYVRSTTPKGHTKKRVENFAAPIDLNIDRLSVHVAGVIKDLTHRKWLIDANWVVNNKAIMGAVEDAMGVEYRAMFKDWVRNTVNDRNVDMRQTLGTWNALFETLRLNMMVATMGFKATTLISQIAGLAPSVEVVGGKEGDGLKWMSKSFAKVAFNPQKLTETWVMIKEKSPEMRYRLQNKDRDIRNKLRQLSGKSDLLSQVQEVALQGIGYADLLVTIPTWMAAYDKAQSQGKSEEASIREADRAVRLSQGSGGAKDLAAVQARSGQVMRLLTMYYTPFSAMHNRLRNIGHEFGGIKDVPKAFFAVWWVTLLPAVMGELLVGRGPEEDEDYDTWILKTVVGYAGLGLPWFRDIIGATTSDFGYSFTPIQQVGTTTSYVLKDLGELALGDKPKDEALQDLALSTFRASGYWLGVPTSQLQITGGYMYDLATGEDDAEDAVRKFLYRRDED